MRWFITKYKSEISKKIFDELMMLLQLNNDKSFCDNIFYLFDENKDNIINYKELIIGLEMFRKDTFANKMRSQLQNKIVFVDVCDENDDGFIDVDEFSRTLKQYLVNKNDTRLLPTIST